MALLQANFFSQSMYRTVTIQVILPVDKFSMPGEPARGDKPFKTLYLLHGLMGSHNDWISGTRIQSWAEQRNLAVVMPSGDNSFYLDYPAVCNHNNNYSAFIGSELVEITRKMFPLSHDREDTYIAGLSMGGSGAIRNGLKYHETFGYVAGLSSDIHVVEYILNAENNEIIYGEKRLESFNDTVASDKNPRVPALVQIIKNRMKAGELVSFPKMFMACGTEDDFINANRVYRDFFTENGLDVTYYEEAGGHDWDFWDKYILKVLDWLPLEGVKRIPI